MKRATLAFLAAALTVTFVYGCEETSNPLDSEVAATSGTSTTPTFKRPDNLPGVGGAKVHFAYVGSLGTGGHFLTDMVHGVTTFTETNVTDFTIGFDVEDIRDCVPVLSPQIFGWSPDQPHSYSVQWNDAVNGFDVQCGTVVAGTTTPFAIGVTVLAVCGP